MKLTIIYAILVTAVLGIGACGELSNPQVIVPYVEPAETVDPYFNRPFITIDETIQLHYGITTSSVQTLCGKPLYIALGNENKVVWVYVVREIFVGDGIGNSQLIKSGSINKFASQLHYLGLTFEYGALISWAPISPNVLFNNIIFGDHLDIPTQE